MTVRLALPSTCTAKALLSGCKSSLFAACKTSMSFSVSGVQGRCETS